MFLLWIMATARFPNEKDDCEIQCPGCKGAYSLTEHRPKILPCDHTICKQCIRNMDEDFHCPVCEFHIQSKDLLAMATNFVALELAEKSAECYDKLQISESKFKHIANGNSTIEASEETPLQLEVSNVDEPDINENDEGNNSNDQQCDSGEKTPTISASDSTESENHSGALTSTLAKLGKKYRKLETNKSEDKEAEVLDPSTISTFENLELDLDCKFSHAFDLTSQKMLCYGGHIKTVKSTKIETLNDIDAEFEHFVQLLLRRRQLLKNQALTQYKEKLEDLEEKMEKVTYTTMCLTSLHKHSDIVFSSHSATPYEGQTDEDFKQKLIKLNQNVRKIESEIDELVEQLTSDSGNTPEKRQGFLYHSYGSDEFEKAIRTLGRVKLQGLSEHDDDEEPSEF